MRILVTKILLTISLAITTTQPTLARDQPLKIGVCFGSGAQIFGMVKQEATKQGLNIQLIEFGDFVHINAALAAGELDANCCLNKVMIDNANADHGYKLVSIAKTVIFPIGIYS